MYLVIYVNRRIFTQTRRHKLVTIYPVFVALKHASEIGILIIGARRGEVLNTGDHLVILLELSRLKNYNFII